MLESQLQEIQDLIITEALLQTYRQTNVQLLPYRLVDPVDDRMQFQSVMDLSDTVYN